MLFLVVVGAGVGVRGVWLMIDVGGVSAEGGDFGGLLGKGCVLGDILGRTGRMEGERGKGEDEMR